MQKKYRRMLAGMKRKEKAKRRKSDLAPWFLYILECNGGTFYTGITKDLERRLKMHNAGKASRYTRTHLPVKLLYHEKCKSRAQALIRECTVKAYPKNKKAELAYSNFAPNTV